MQPGPKVSNRVEGLNTWVVCGDRTESWSCDGALPHAAGDRLCRVFAQAHHPGLCAITNEVISGIIGSVVICTKPAFAIIVESSPGVNEIASG